jgi:membrane protein implicated in regulation of membrane protease activity
MDALALFGLFAVAAMLACYAAEDLSPWFVLAFAGACALASVYGFLQGAWPFGAVEAIWAVVALRRWWRRLSNQSRRDNRPRLTHDNIDQPHREAVQHRASGVLPPWR